MQIPNQRMAAAKVFEEQVNEMAQTSTEELADMDQNVCANMDAHFDAVAQTEMPAKQMIQQAMANIPNVVSSSFRPKPRKAVMPVSSQKTSEELQLEKGALQVRETGWGLWRSVVVPPNAYVVQRRLGKKEPITMGLGISFRYRPRTDSYFIVPAAMQTIGIVARGISREKQGINILAYVQWLISDFSVAYRRLDFSDPKDPMGIVNAQLREQAEAAIKDKIATMTVEEILTDKAPIIAELTQRMKTVAEGNIQGGGLGLQIVTVQIKEAYISSTRLWEFLQAPFRNERERESRLSRLKMEQTIRQQELTNKEQAETSESQTKAAIEKFKATQEAESYEVVVRERLRQDKMSAEQMQQQLAITEERDIRHSLSEKKVAENDLQTAQEMALLKMKQEQEREIAKAGLAAEQAVKAKEIAVNSRLQELALEEKLHVYEHKLKLQDLEAKKQLIEADSLVAGQDLEAKLAIKNLELDHTLKTEERKFQMAMVQEQERTRLGHQQKEAEIVYERSRQEVANGVSSNHLTHSLIAHLPELVKGMPQIQELKAVQISSHGAGDDGFSLLTNYVARLLGIAKVLGLNLPQPTVPATPASQANEIKQS